jgi:hypothetical protein
MPGQARHDGNVSMKDSKQAKGVKSDSMGI